MSNIEASTDSPATDSPSSARSITVDGFANFILNSLQHHVDEFLLIRKELEEYSGPTEAEMSAIHRSIWNTWGQSPDIGKPEFFKAVQNQVQVASEKNYFRVMKYYEKFYLHSLPIVLLSHALLETHIMP